MKEIDYDLLIPQHVGLKEPEPELNCPNCNGNGGYPGNPCEWCKTSGVNPEHSYWQSRTRAPQLEDCHIHPEDESPKVGQKVFEETLDGKWVSTAHQLYPAFDIVVGRWIDAKEFQDKKAHYEYFQQQPGEAYQGWELVIDGYSSIVFRRGDSKIEFWKNGIVDFSHFNEEYKVHSTRCQIPHMTRKTFEAVIENLNNRKNGSN